MTNKLTLQMMSALQNLPISSKFLLGPREVNLVVAWRLVQREKQFGCVLWGKLILECNILVLNLLLYLSAGSTCFVSTQARRVIHCMQTGTRSVVRPFKRSLGLQIDNAGGDRIVMLTHAMLFIPKAINVKSLLHQLNAPSKMSLSYESAIVPMCYVV